VSISARSLIAWRPKVLPSAARASRTSRPGSQIAMWFAPARSHEAKGRTSRALGYGLEYEGAFAQKPRDYRQRQALYVERCTLNAAR
jgi:hypothetical protein